METDVLNSVSFSGFDSVTLIDILNDKVSIFACNDKLTLVETNTYVEYLDKLKKILYPDDLNRYFESTSLNSVKNNGNEVTIVSYSKLSSTLSYDKFIDIIKLLPNDIMCIYSVKGSTGNTEATLTGTSSNTDNDYEMADLIINIEDIFREMTPDSYETKNSVKYITNLLEGVKANNPEVLKSYTERVTVEVSKTNNSILLVDDDPLMRNILKKVFKDGYNVLEAPNGMEAVKILEANFAKENLANPINVVGMFLDLKMPVMDGFGVLDYMRDKNILSRIPVIIISADDAKDTKTKVYNYDIADMIEKPFNYQLIRKRVTKLIDMYSKTSILKDLVRSKDSEIKKLLKGYSKAYLTDYEIINEKLKIVSKELLNNYISKSGEVLDVDTISDAAKYYDVGLNCIPKKFLNNMGSITDEEKKIVLNYPSVGARIVNLVAEKQSDIFIKYASTITKMHNERYDGKGFPEGLAQNKIPMYMYLVNIAIDYASLRCTNLSSEEVKNIINGKANAKYPQEAVNIFNEIYESIKEI